MMVFDLEVMKMRKDGDNLNFKVGINRLMRDVGFDIKKGDKLTVWGWTNAGNIGVFDDGVVASIPRGTILTLDVNGVMKSVLLTTGLDSALRIEPAKRPDGWDEVPFVKLDRTNYLKACRHIEKGFPIVSKNARVQIN